MRTAADLDKTIAVFEMTAARNLAAAVIEQAFKDLNDKRTREAAERFLLSEMWEPSCVWGSLLSLSEGRIKREVRRRLGVLQ